MINEQNKQILWVIVIAIICFLILKSCVKEPTPESYFIYQEDADTVKCDTLWEYPDYGCANACCGANYNNCCRTFDGNWTTVGCAKTFFDAEVYFNYTKPLGATNNSLWQYGASVIAQNTTIPSSCWDYSDSLYFRVQVYQWGAGGSLSCWNGSWVRLSGIGGCFWEEGMFWNFVII